MESNGDLFLKKEDQISKSQRPLLQTKSTSKFPEMHEAY